MSEGREQDEPPGRTLRLRYYAAKGTTTVDVVVVNKSAVPYSVKYPVLGLNAINNVIAVSSPDCICFWPDPLRPAAPSGS